MLDLSTPSVKLGFAMRAVSTVVHPRKHAKSCRSSHDCSNAEGLEAAQCLRILAVTRRRESRILVLYASNRAIPSYGLGLGQGADDGDHGASLSPDPSPLPSLLVWP